VSDPATLATLAAEVGLDADAAMAALVSGEYEDAVRAGQQQARDLDIHAVPTFVVERRFAIPGAQDPETFVSVLARMQSKLADERDDATD
jgi:predicted DsbA family dithiol-disulfide isomerase